ncbi:MAG: GH116 family glycosyl-hydrolase [Anaerolineae bacterium]
MPTKYPQWPVIKYYDQEHLRRTALPLGGIGTGTVSLGGRGNLTDWEIVNRPAKGFQLQNSFFALYTKVGDGEPVMRALEGVIPPEDYEGARGAEVPNHGLPRFRQCVFEAAYPLGQVILNDTDVPLSVRLQAFNPLIPCDADASGIPVAIFRFILYNNTDQPVSAAIAGSLQNFIGADGTRGKAQGNFNTYREEDGLRGIYMQSNGLLADAEQFGTLALTTTAEHVTYRTAWANYNWGDSLLDFWDDFGGDGRLENREQDGVDAPMGSLAVNVDVPAQGEAAITFLLTWHFPNRMAWREAGVNHPQSGFQTDTYIGNYYATQYADAWQVAAKTAARLQVLEDDTVKFVQAFAEADLPDVVKESALFNVSTLRTQTVFRTADGNVFGWEGCDDTQGCCFGSCTHVWNYEQATAFLFGDLALKMREVEFLHATREDGGMSFRVELPLDKASQWSVAAADGQMGCIMKVYRDWQLAGDEEWLLKVWPMARRALEFCWRRGGWDADKDGVMEGCQHNTMDVEYYGPNPQMGIWYLGALRACEEMARHVGEKDFADECHALYANGREWIDAHLFNGEYYEHEIRPVRSNDDIFPMLIWDMGAKDVSNPVLQLGAGCLVDQLVGQYMAHVCGLGYVVDPEHARQTLQSIMKHNFKTGFYDHFNHLRSFVLNDESALVMATYPRGQRPARPFPYYNEVMTGFEYTAAVGMMYEGLDSDGLKCIEAVRERYDGRKRSPFDEAECGHHYARAMASWAAVLALTGFHYSAVDHSMAFKASDTPVTYFWSNGYAWGTCQQTPGDTGSAVELRVLHGSLRLHKLTLKGGGSVTFDDGRTIEAGDRLQCRVQKTG